MFLRELLLVPLFVFGHLKRWVDELRDLLCRLLAFGKVSVTLDLCSILEAFSGVMAITTLLHEALTAELLLIQLSAQTQPRR